MEKLTSHYKPKRLKIAECFRFYRRSQLKSENVADYLAELRRLALMREFDNFLNEALCDRFVCGLQEEAIQRTLLAEADLTLTKALTLAQSMETAQKDLKEIHPTSVESDMLGNKSAHYISFKKQPVCHRCLGSGLLPGACRFKSAKCNKCHKTGHIAKACLTTDPSKQSRRRQTDQSTNQKQVKKHTNTHQIEQESSSQPECTYTHCQQTFPRATRC